MTDQGSKPKVLSRIAQFTAALSKLMTIRMIWKDKNISLSSKIRLMGSLIVSVLSYACETWTLIADIQEKLQATEMRCLGNCWHLVQKTHH